MNIFDFILIPLRELLISVLSSYFRIVPVPQSLSLLKERDDKICIITESDSLILEALMLSFSTRIGLPRFVNILKERADESKITWIALHNEKALETLTKSEKITSVATLNIFSGRGPISTNPAYRLNFWELLGILLLGKFLIIFMGKPIRLSSLPNRNLLTLRRVLRIDFYKNLKLVRGTPFQSIQAQERVVLGGSEFQSEMTQLADKLSMSRAAVIRKTRHSFYEIAANPRRPMYRIIASLVRFMNNRLFSSVQCLGLENLKESIRDRTVVLVPMHRSHLDYLLLGCELYHAHFIPPLVAAGINLSFWPAGFMIRSVGAYFVKRNVSTDRLHALILKRYVTYLVKRGHMQEFFIEGGRSRSGRMRQPKVGLLNIFVDAHFKGYKRDIAFVPVAITYENVIEDSVYGQENTGSEKQKESLLGLFKASSIFKKRYGDVVVNFGEAISLDKYIENEKGLQNKNSETSRISVNNLAIHLTQKIREQTNPSLTSLLHTALLMSPSYGLSKKELISTTQNLGKLLEITRGLNSRIGENTPSLKQFLGGNYNLIHDFSSSRAINHKFCLGEEVFFIPGQKRFTADFYKNSTIHLFIDFSIFSLLDLLNMDINRDNILQFYNIFAHDFILKEKNVFLSEAEVLIEKLIKLKILKREAGKTSYADKTPGIYIPALLLPNIQSIVWCSQVLEILSESTDVIDNDEIDTRNKSVDYDLAMKHMLNEFRVAMYKGNMTCTEASSSVAINSALETMHQMGVIFLNSRQTKGKRIVIKNPTFDKLDLIFKSNKALTSYGRY